MEGHCPRLKGKRAVYTVACIIALFTLLWYTGFFNLASFIDTIESKENDHAIVKIEEEMVEAKASVDLSVAQHKFFWVGDKVEVGYRFIG